MTRTLGRWLAMLGLLAGTLTPAVTLTSSAHAAARIPDTRIEYAIGEIHPRYYPDWCVTGRTPWRTDAIVYVAECTRSGGGQVWKITRYVPVGLGYISVQATDNPVLCIGQKAKLFTWWAVKAVDCSTPDPRAFFHVVMSIDHGDWIIDLVGPNRLVSSPPTLRRGKEYALQWVKSGANPKTVNQHWVFPAFHV